MRKWIEFEFSSDVLSVLFYNIKCLKNSKRDGKGILQVPDTGTRVLDNTGPFLRSSIVSF